MLVCLLLQELSDAPDIQYVSHCQRVRFNTPPFTWLCCAATRSVYHLIYLWPILLIHPLCSCVCSVIFTMGS